MTPQEKARELIDKALELENIFMVSSSQNKIAKNIALTIVDEIIGELKMNVCWEWVLERKGGEETQQYWLEVRTHINNILS